MRQFNVGGMSCAACSSRVEKAVSKLAGVENCSVSLLTNSMGVEGTASAGEIIKAVEKAGYTAEEKIEHSGGSGTAGVKNAAESGASEAAVNAASALDDKETPMMKRRLIASVIVLAVLMYFSMGEMMLGLTVPEAMKDNHVAMGLVQLLLTAVIMVINQKFFVSGFRGIIHRSPNMDTLVALGAGAAFVYSTYALFAMTGAQAAGDHGSAAAYMQDFYFESAGMILTLITVGKLLEARSKGKTTDALRSLMELAPQTAVIIRDEQEVEVPVVQVQPGDIFVVRPGESIPVDGIITEGISAVNEAALTGESIPADKGPGDTVSAATINQSGFLKCEASRVGEDTTLSQIIKMVGDAAATKAPAARVADKVSAVFVPAVIGIALITFAVWMLAGQTAGFALARGISVLVISCPCALGLATPVAIMVGNGVGARSGILFKTAEALEETGKADTVVLDKTGTVTRGEPEVTDILTADGWQRNELLKLAYSLEVKSEHPLAKAVSAAAEEEKITAEDVNDFIAVPGNGLSARLGESILTGGNMNFAETQFDISDAAMQRARELSAEGKTPMFFGKDRQFAGVIAVADTIKDGSAQAVDELKHMGIDVVMLTGDNQQTAETVGRQAGISTVIAGVMPDGKEKAIFDIQKNGRVIMVGDGINDAPALTRADIGIAIGAGTDVAIDAADVVLVNSRLKDVTAAIRLSRATLRNIHQNLFWAFIYNVIGIPLAAGVWIPLLGWQLNPMFAAAAMSLSSFCVVTNALRLNLTDIRSPGRDRKKVNKTKVNNKEKQQMKKTMKIEGMMCMHCEARVRKCLEAIPEVESAEVSHEKGTAVVELSDALADDVLKKTVEDQDYTVTSIE
ncbi:MAG: heavy metal translocating P-type ATPase [Firmicutes bacterium]|nr:heavy metal translocating P-type ATPase [Bacillota bacterium]